VKSQLEGERSCLQYRGLRTVRCAEPHAQAPRGALVPMSEEARPMSKTITSFVGLDVHIDSNAIGVAEAGARPRDSSAR